MISLDSRDEVVRLRTEFDLAWRGYDRGQVQVYVHTTDAELWTLTVDRDAAVSRAEELACQLEDVRSDNSRLRARLDRICRTPIEPDGLQERLRRRVELAKEEAAQILARAQAAAEKCRPSTVNSSSAPRPRRTR
jgi:hypothetical protein